MGTNEPSQVLIFDTTLRDGEQAPGAAFDIEEKVEVARILDDMKVDIIEAGFPISSKGDFKSVQSVSKVVENATVCALTRARRGDIDAAVEALAGAKRKRIHTFISTSALHMKHKLNMTPDAVLEAIKDSVSYARQFCDDVEWSCEDGTRSDPEFLWRCFETAIKAGASTVNIADTVGYILPAEFTALIEGLYAHVPGMEDVRFSVHCHDDLGLATANSLAAISAGARQVECSINGLGERAGNASLEEVVMTLHTRQNVLPFSTNLDTTLLTTASKVVSDISHFPVPPNKAIVGSNAFAHESGIHQHGVINHPNTYEIMTPEVVGATGSRLVMGRKSGRHAFKMKLEELSCHLELDYFEKAFMDFKDFADTKKKISDDEILNIANKYQQA
ncbi:MAG: 2-isopropylmalate synthase [Methylococcales bacterium]|jgi:2-isopropylmalate synthase|nr:2-isopropylmalate synthase [Methylococcales bacterium]MBT7445679.1 2-isopropylmalate synthase [Methylococcales bacterium]